MTGQNNDAAHSAEEIQAWITAKVAEAAQVDVSEVDIAAPINELGVDSLDMLTLTGDVAEWLGVDIPASLFWELPAIEDVSQRLARLCKSDEAELE